MKRSPSPALVISIVALFVALGGTSYAAVKLNGKNIKKGTVAGKALKKNTLTGTQIKESKLAKVPKAAFADAAANADNAGSAGNAQTVGGLSPQAFTQGTAKVITANKSLSNATAAEFTIIELPGLIRLRASCNITMDTIFRAESAGTDVRMTVERTASGGTTLSGGFWDDGQGVVLPAGSSQTVVITGWREIDSSSAGTINASAQGCRIGAVAVGRA